MKTANKIVVLTAITAIVLIGGVAHEKISQKLLINSIEQNNKEIMELVKKENKAIVEPIQNINPNSEDNGGEGNNENDKENDNEDTNKNDTKNSLANKENSRIEKQTLPSTTYLEAHFICQAPLETEANWTLHEESCEEAALLQTYLFEKNEKMDKQTANKTILEMIEWQKQNFLGHKDIYADEIKKLAIGFFNLEPEEIIIHYNAEIEDLKKILAKGHTIMAPVTASYLKNPYYPHQGYHMLQVIGYTETHIITNDNGTKKGANFSYSYEDFEKAMKDSNADIIYIKLN